MDWTNSFTILWCLEQEQTIKASQAHELEGELAKLKEQNASLNRKVTELSGLETAKKKAETKVQQLEEKMEEMISEKVSQKENELHATYDEKLRNYEDRCAYWKVRADPIAN